MAEKTVCLPPCAPVVGALPVGAPAAAPPTAAAPFPVVTETCVNGVLTDVTLQATQTVQVAWPKDTVLKVRECSGEFDHHTLCSPGGDRVIAVVSYGATGIPSTTYYNLAGNVYAGNVSLLSSCGNNLESDELAWCAGGVNFTQWIEKDAGQPTGVAYWTDESGALVAAPVGATRGVCVVERKALIYIERNGGTVTMADIVAATGSNKITSVTVKQIAGSGFVKADSGSGSPMDAGETWSWSAVSDENSDHLSSSSLTMDAGGGEQRITAIYTL